MLDSAHKAGTVTGLTAEVGATVTSGNYSATVDEEGDWKMKLILLEGRNRAYFTASDKAGNETTAAIIINYDAPTSTTVAPTTTRASCAWCR